MTAASDAHLRVDPPPGVRLAGTGMAVPERVLTNADLEKMVDTSDEWIVQRTGIRQRRIAEDGQGVVELSTRAMQQALTNAAIDPSQLDLLVCATMTPDMICPAAACQIVDRLGAVPCGAVDLSAACTGFVAGMNIAFNFVRSGAYRAVGVVGAEVLSGLTNWDDRSTCILFGDGAGAAVVTASDNPAQTCLYQVMHSDGSRGMELYCPRHESQLPAPGAGAEFSGKLNTLQMNGREIYKFAVTTLQQSIRDAMDACGLSPDDVKMVIPHQSNERIIASARDKLGFDADKVYVNIDRYGNTSAASVGLCLHELMADGRLGEGDIVIFVAIGGGLTWATSVWRL